MRWLAARVDVCSISEEGRAGGAELTNRVDRSDAEPHNRLRPDSPGCDNCYALALGSMARDGPSLLAATARTHLLCALALPVPLSVAEDGTVATALS